MKKLTTIMVFAIGTSFSAQAADENLMKSRKAVMTLGKSLKSNLLAQMKKAGPIGALEFCDQL